MVAHKRHQNLHLFQKGLGGGKTVHDGQGCTRCSICGQQSQRYCHISSKQDLTDDFRDKICQTFKISPSSCLCYKCYLKVLRFKEQKVPQTIGVYPCELHQYGLCQNNSKRAISVKLNSIYQCFKIGNMFACSSVETDEERSIYFCDEHRLKMIKYQKQLKCSKCYRSLTHEIHHIDSEIDVFLKDNPELSKKEVPESCKLGSAVCTGCYSYLKKSASESTPFLSSIQSESTPSLSSIQSESTPSLSSIQSIILNSALLLEASVSFQKFILNIGSCFLENQVFLASELFKSFKHVEDDGECKSEDDLLQRLSEIFGDNIVILSFHFTPERLVKYCKNNDNHSLVNLLSRLSAIKQEGSKKDCETEHLPLLVSGVSDHSALIQSTEYLRQMIFTLINRTISLDLGDQFDLQSLNFKDFVKKVVPEDLWNFIFTVTQTKKSKKLPASWTGHFFDDNFESESHSLTKFYRRLSIICNILYTVDDRCRHPLHILMADILEKYTDSSDDCLHIFNTFGICASKSSLQRFQTETVTKMKNLENLLPDSFTIVSADNLNKRSSYAVVKAAQEGSRGFDGLSVQALQPKPVTLKLNPEEKTDFGTNCKTLDSGMEVKNIRIHGDESLYRSLLLHINKFIQLCARNDNGSLVDDSVIPIEDLLTTNLINHLENYSDTEECGSTFFSRLGIGNVLSEESHLSNLLFFCEATGCNLHFHKADASDNSKIIKAGEIGRGGTFSTLNIFVQGHDFTSAFSPLLTYEQYKSKDESGVYSLDDIFHNLSRINQGRGDLKTPVTYQIHQDRETYKKNRSRSIDIKETSIGFMKQTTTVLQSESYDNATVLPDVKFEPMCITETDEGLLEDLKNRLFTYIR